MQSNDVESVVKIVESIMNVSLLLSMFVQHVMFGWCLAAFEDSKRMEGAWTRSNSELSDNRSRQKLTEHLLLIAKRRGQHKKAVSAAVQAAMAVCRIHSFVQY